MCIKDIRQKINEYFLESEREGLATSKTRVKGSYPNALLVTKKQYTELLKEMFHLSDETKDDLLFNIKVLAIEGLEVVFTDYIEEPKVLRISK